MRPVKVWPPAAKRNYARTLETLAGLKVEHFDAMKELSDLVVSEGPLGEPAGDLMHPSKELCDRFAARLKASGFLEPR